MTTGIERYRRIAFSTVL